MAVVEGIFFHVKKTVLKGLARRTLPESFCLKIFFLREENVYGTFSVFILKLKDYSSFA